jgi:DNA invertase Pin-like site-specific DNA recombinase
MIVGYARVSTDGQTLDAAALKAAGADRVFDEKISGAVTDRKALAKALAGLALATCWWSLGWIGSPEALGTYQYP